MMHHENIPKVLYPLLIKNAMWVKAYEAVRFFKLSHDSNDPLKLGFCEVLDLMGESTEKVVGQFRHPSLLARGPSFGRMGILPLLLVLRTDAID